MHGTYIQCERRTFEVAHRWRTKLANDVLQRGDVRVTI
jgi:hypothetical protein